MGLAKVDMPKIVRVGVHPYSILRKQKGQMGDNLGDCDGNVLQISVAKRLKKTVAQETLLHEVLHACNYPSFVGKENISEEDIVNACAPVLLQVIRENPTLVAYLLS